MKLSRGPSAPINPDTGTFGVEDCSIEAHKTKTPKSKPEEVDWDEDLRPTPNETVENKGTNGGTNVADTDPNRPKTVDRKKGSKRAIPPKPQTTSAKRRKSNTRKSTTTKEDSSKGPQLPLITLATGVMPPPGPLGNSGPSDMGPLDGKSKDYATKHNGQVPEAPHQPLSPKYGHNKHGNNSKGSVIVEIRSCTSVTTDSSSDFEDHGKGPSGTSKVSILEHRAQSNRETNKGKLVHVMPELSSSSDIDKGQSRTTTSKVTILESRARPNGSSSKTKAVHEKSQSKHHGRAESVGNKLMLALHRAEPSQNEPVNDPTAPLIISSDPVQPEESPPKQLSDKMPTETALALPAIESVSDGTIPFGMHQNQTEPKTVNPALIAKTLPPKEDQMQQADDADFWRLLGDDRLPTTASSSEFESGRGLMGAGPSILDYHMEMEHIPGFATLQPMRSEPTTSSYVTNICESQANSSSELSNVGKFDDPTAGWNEGHGSSPTPESQKPLLTNESLMGLNSVSPEALKSVPKTSIVDSNGSPRLMPQSVKSMFVPQLDLDVEKGHEETTSVTDTSLSEYDRDSSCSLSTESKYEGAMWTKFQRDMFLEYGIQLEKLERSYPWPPPKEHHPSFSQEDTADRAKFEKASTIGRSSSQRTLDERALGDAPSKNHGYLDQSFRTDISASTQRAAKSHQASTVDSDDMEWISTLQVAQKDAHHLLQQTNSNLSTQLAAEKATISRVLEIYREGCSRILDDLFQAQEARMQLYRQQMQSVKEQHADICQDLVRGLQELDRRVQQGPI
ncbi:hypothetical protein N7516_006405 [Penicillium verrucosum]|uniref:uncharacterized protein n=1 Tax=Penicillium verrucosum TaxID=60171 RepID=UPI002544F84E|nr:uncharacterized protein N7516_006405 [Penicillium verrucosum]KAJ5931916.1 hypothetical protein N7516_006405 [Penicillium verrucosum]